jgi:hypothetical protein
MAGIDPQEEAAGGVKEKEGDYMAALGLYLMGGLPGKAAALVMRVGAVQFDRGMLDTITSSLSKVNVHLAVASRARPPPPPPSASLMRSMHIDASVVRTPGARGARSNLTTARACGTRWGCMSGRGSLWSSWGGTATPRRRTGEATRSGAPWTWRGASSPRR